MATIDEILAAMPEEAALEAHDYLVIDPDTRQIDVPESESIFGVENDGKAEIKYFCCPRIVGSGVDLAACFLRVNFRNANGGVDAYLVQDVAVSGDLVTFSWPLSRKVTQYKGLVQFVVCASYPGSDGTISTEWHTTLASGNVLEGMEPDASAVEASTSDVIAQLLALVESQSAAVQAEGAKQITAVQAAADEATASAKEQVEAKGAATLATIPEDYTTLAAKVNGLANAIKGKATGEIVRVDDVAPVEHTMAVKVRGKNILPYPYLQATHTGSGGTFTAQTDGGVMASGTPTDYVSLNLYNGVPLAKSGNLLFSASGEYENITIFMFIQDAADNTLFMGEAWKGAPPISVNLDDYPMAAKWQIAVKRSSPNIEMSGTIYPQLELGDTATAYVPYVAPEAVKVTRCGKNLVSGPGVKFEGTGIEWTINDDGTITANGTAETQCVCNCDVKGWNAALIGKTVTLSGCPAGGSIETYSVVQRNYGKFDTGSGITFVIDNNNFGAWGARVEAGVTVNNIVFKPQLELGAAATAYEPYTGAEYIPEADGSVPGVTSLAPTTSLLTDTPGVTVELEYNRDTNLVIADILEKIAALGGTT